MKGSAPLLWVLIAAVSIGLISGCEKKQPDPPAATENSTITVWVTDTGTKYHAAGCSYLNQSAHSMSKKGALAAGYTPDTSGRCTPP